MSPKIGESPPSSSDARTLTRADDAPATSPEASGGRDAAGQRFFSPPSPASSERLEDPDAELVHEEAFEQRYELRTKLGEGGMGEVHLCKDRRIGREVAIKAIRPSHGSRLDLRKRFLREVRVQGQLEHPSIVPVYDLARDLNGNAYFTMKRVRGQTLEQILTALRGRDADAARQHTRFKLLAAFGTACLAVHFAHSRGVLHRDLKPGNVMLGGFGEVYVLDWGLAKVTRARDASSPVVGRPPASSSGAARSADARGAETATGALMGTPGYMAPEQIRPDLAAMGPGTDIYALGAILFEILALEPLHGRGTPDYLMASTLRGVDVAGAVRRAECDVAPELLAIVTRATAPDPAHRFETAREMQEELERFLNGDRDLERRRELARVHAGAAYDAAMRALEGGDSSEERSRAMREVSRAMALDPQNGEALKTLVRLMTDVPPRALPADAQREVDAQARDWQRTGSRIAGFAYLSWSLNAPLAYIMGVSSWPRIMTLEALWLAASWMSFHTSRHPHPAGKTGYSLIVVSNLAIACTAWLFGPFVLVPALAAVNAVSFVIGTDRSRRALAILLGCLAILLPLLLEWIGVDGRSYTFEGGRFVVWPRALAFPATPTLVFLVVTNILFFVTPALLIGRFKDVLSQTENRLYMQTWHLRQFVPNEASSIASARPASNASGAIAES